MFSLILQQYNELTSTPIKNAYDSDQDTNDTSSQTSSSCKGKSLNFDAIEIDVKPKRKNFPTSTDRTKYIQDYQKKFKTELCKNFLLKGSCRYGSTCCFAHGEQELVNKTEYTCSYKTKPCKKFFLNGYCPYGYRCQYLHHDVKECPQYYNFLKNLYKQNSLIIDARLPNSYQNQLTYLEENQQLLPVSSRLSIFQKLESSHNQI